MRPLTIIQARVGSQRLPGKVFAKLGDRVALEHVIDRVRQADIGPLVVATTWEPEDDELFDFCADIGVACFRGATDDVLSRFRVCHDQFGGDPVVRVTADCPFLDPGLLQAVVAKLGERHDYIDGRGALSRFDYVGVKGAPDGYHQEAFTAKALAFVDGLATSQEDREHVVTYMLARPQMFRLGWVQADIQGEPVTLDTQDDLERLRRLAS